MNWNVIKVGLDMPLVKIEFPLIGTTGILSSCLGIGIYNPRANVGYLFNRIPHEAGNAHDLLVPEFAGKIDGDLSRYYALLSGMRQLCQPERGIAHTEAKTIDGQIDDVLVRLGFDRKNISRRYCRKYIEVKLLERGELNDIEMALEMEEVLERGEIVIDTQRGLAEIRISDELLPSYSVHCRVAGRIS